MQISKSNDPRIVKNDPYLSLYLQSVTDTSRTGYIGLNEVFEDIRAVIPNMTPERGRSINPKMQPLPDKWQFCNILNKVNHDDPDEFEARIADVLFWTLPFAGNPVCCIPLRRNEDYLIQTKEETGQYTLDLFADDAVADVLSYHKFWAEPENDDLTALAAQAAFDVLKDLNKKGLSCFSSGSHYIQKTFLKGMPDKDADKVADLAEQLLITSGLMDNTNRKTDDNDIRLSLSCLGESFINIIDSINPGKINYLYFKNYDMNFRFALCERIAKQIVSDGYDFYMSIEKTERSEKRSVAKPVKTKEPLNIWETYIVKPEEKKPAPKFVEPEPEPESKPVIKNKELEMWDESVKIAEIKACPKALSEQEVKEEMHRPIISSSSETEENKSYTSNLTPRPPFVPPQDPLVLARDTDKIDEDRVLALSQHITEFMVKEKSNLPPNVKTALKEALMALMEL